MAAPTLPNLTWGPSAVTALSGPTGQEILDAIAALLTASTHWKVQSSADGYVEAAPKSVDVNVKDVRILFSSNNTTGMWLDSVPGGAYVTMGIASVGGAGTLAGYDSADPYSDGKFSGYSRILRDTMENLWIIESEEILCVCGEDTDWMSHYNGANSNHCGYFSPTLGWTALVRLELVTVAMTGNGYLTSEDGAQCGLPFHYRHSLAPTNFVGAARDIVMARAGVLASGVAPAVSRFVGRRMGD